MNTFKFLSLFVAIYGLQAQAGGADYGGTPSYGGLYQYYQGQSQDQGYAQPAQPYAFSQMPSTQNYGQSYGQSPYSQGYSSSDEGQAYGNYGQPSRPYGNSYGQGQQAPSNSYGNAYGSSDPYGFDSESPIMPRGYGNYNDQYGQYGAPNSPASPYQGPQTTPDSRRQRPSRDSYGYQNPQDSMGSEGSDQDDSQQPRLRPHHGQIGSRNQQSDADSFMDQKKSCSDKLSDAQKKDMVKVVEESVSTSNGTVSDALKNKKISMLKTSVMKLPSLADDCQASSQVVIQYKTKMDLVCTLKANTQLDPSGKATFVKEQSFVCGDESHETDVRTGVDVYKTNFEKPAVAPSKGGRA